MLSAKEDALITVSFLRIVVSLDDKFKDAGFVSLSRPSEWGAEGSNRFINGGGLGDCMTLGEETSFEASPAGTAAG